VLRPAGEQATPSVASSAQSGWRFIRSLFSDRPDLFAALAIPATVLGLVNTIFSVIFPYYLTRFPQVIWLAAGYSLLILLISNTVTWTSAWLKRRFGLLIGECLGGFAERLDQRYYTSGDLYTRYQDIDNIVEIVIQLSRDLPYAAIVFLGAISYMIYVNWLLTAVVLTIVALLLVVITPFVNRAREYVYQIRLRLARMNNDVHRFVEGGGIAPGKSWAGVLDAKYRQTLWRMPVSALLGQTATLGLLAVIAFARAQSTAPSGYARLMSLITIMNYLTSAGTSLYGHYVDWQLAQPSIRRLQDFMESKGEQAAAA
jgi:ABC-type bacteriocin/lantibiotic exporter with double-glycine peptidase domain